MATEAQIKAAHGAWRRGEGLSGIIDAALALAESSAEIVALRASHHAEMERLLAQLADTDERSEASGNARPSWPASAIPASHRVLSHRIDRLVEDLRALASRVEQLKPGVISLAARNSEVPP
jgi:hypothetical protein